MKKMTKGAIVTGLGVALLLGGGGTLATWNAERSVNAGTIQSGNMGLEAPAGTWTLAGGSKVNLANYKIVPGEQLTYTQNVKIIMDGSNKLTADLSIVGLPKTPEGKNTFKHLDIVEYSLKGKDGVVVDQTKGTAVKNIPAGDYTASATFKFNSDGWKSLDDTNAAMNLDSVSYVLTQNDI